MIEIPDKFLSRIEIGGLKGRMLELPAKEDSEIEILSLYGIHSSQERMYTYAQFFNRYGKVIMPDLPGFGGMDSFYRIGRVPDIDSYADYLYTFFITYKLDKKKIRVIAMSFGFLAITRMLQKHPELAKNIDFVISFVGFGKSSDLDYAYKDWLSLKMLLNTGSTQTGSATIGALVFNRYSLRVMFAVFRLFNPKYMHKDKKLKSEATEMELDLWTKNDPRTHAFTSRYILNSLDLTKDEKPIDTIQHNLTTKTDQYLNEKQVKKTLRKLYKKNYEYQIEMPLHAPSMIGTEEQVAEIFSGQIEKILEK